MKIEYLLFNMIILAGPIMLSFDRRVAFYRHWPRVAVATIIPLIPFVIWDSWVTGRHWWFNESYTLDYRLAGLPLGEWLFFISVPYACLFIWECLGTYCQNRDLPQFKSVPLLLYAALLPGIYLFVIGKEYTGLVLVTLAVLALLDRLLKTAIFRQRRTYMFMAIAIVLMLICNGYLTARPVVLYGEAFQLGIRVFTIPIEDFGYGFVLLLSCVAIYEKLPEVRLG